MPDIQSMCQMLISRALALLTMKCSILDSEKNIDRLVSTYLMEFKDFTKEDFNQENLNKILRAVANMILAETPEAL